MSFLGCASIVFVNKHQLTKSGNRVILEGTVTSADSKVCANGNGV